MLVELFDEAREFTALEAFCPAKNVINGTHRNQFTARVASFQSRVQPALNFKDLELAPRAGFEPAT